MKALPLGLHWLKLKMKTEDKSKYEEEPINHLVGLLTCTDIMLKQILITLS